MIKPAKNLGRPLSATEKMRVVYIEGEEYGCSDEDMKGEIAYLKKKIEAGGDVIITQDLLVYEITGEDANGKVIGRHRATGIARPHFWDRARYFNEDRRLAETLEMADRRDE